MAQSTDDRLRLLVERIERFEEEKRGSGTISAMSTTRRRLATTRRSCARSSACRMRADDRREMEAILDVYKNALGID
jgi:uncharacterized protein (UPF0335 family)